MRRQSRAVAAGAAAACLDDALALLAQLLGLLAAGQRLGHPPVLPERLRLRHQLVDAPRQRGDLRNNLGRQNAFLHTHTEGHSDCSTGTMRRKRQTSLGAARMRS
jgi:hypothetical protein